MYAVEFEADIAGDKVQIPSHLLDRIPAHRQVKVILLLPEEDVNNRHQTDLKNEILKIGKSCTDLPLLDKRIPNEILGYGENGLPT